MKLKPKLRPRGPRLPSEGALGDGAGQVPVGCLNSDRAHFYGHTLQMLAHSGIRWIRTHADWSITVGRANKTRGKIPAVVACSRDRMHAQKYVTAVATNKSTDGIEIELDEYDREMSRAVKTWQTK